MFASWDECCDVMEARRRAIEERETLAYVMSDSPVTRGEAHHSRPYTQFAMEREHGWPLDMVRVCFG